MSNCLFLLGAILAVLPLPRSHAWQYSQSPRSVGIPKTRDSSPRPFSVASLEAVLAPFIARSVAHPSGPRGELHLDTRRIAYGDLNGDGQQDAVVILDDATGAAAWILAVMNQNGAPTPTDPHVIGHRTVIHSLAIRSGRVSLRITPAGTTQQQMVEFTFAESNDEGRPGLVFSTPVRPGEENPATWLSYSSARHGFSFQYPRNYLLEEMDADVFLEGNRQRTLIDFAILPAASFLSSAVRHAMLYCDTDGPQGGTICRESDVDTVPVRIGAVHGYKMMAHLRDEDTRRLTGETVGPIYFFPLPRSSMLEIYGDFPAIFRTLSIQSDGQ